MVCQAPGGHDGAAAADDAGDPLGGQRDVSQQHPGVHGHVVDTLLALLDHGVAVNLPTQPGGIALDLLQRLVDRHGADRHGGVAQNPFAGGVDVRPGGQVHDGVGSPTDGPHHLVHLLGDRGGDRRVADVGVHLHREGLADDHRFALWMVVVGRDHGPAAGDLVADQIARNAFPLGDERHLRGDLPAAGALQLGAAFPHDAGPRRQSGVQVDGGPRVGVRPRRVVEVEVLSVALGDPPERHSGAVRQVAVGLGAARDRPGGDGGVDEKIGHRSLPTPALPGQVRTVDGSLAVLSAHWQCAPVWVVLQYPT